MSLGLPTGCLASRASPRPARRRRVRSGCFATSQEKLTDVVDSLEGKQTELAKAVDRFPIRVDLLPSDIDEVTGRRVLDKNADGSSAVRAALDKDRNKLATSVALQSDRYKPFSEEDFVRLYPLVPYQLQVLIDAVSARRAQGGAPQTMGGSNRTIIKHTQQLITNPTVGLAGDDVGDARHARSFVHASRGGHPDCLAPRGRAGRGRTRQTTASTPRSCGS